MRNIIIDCSIERETMAYSMNKNEKLKKLFMNRMRNANDSPHTVVGRYLLSVHN